MNLPVQLPGTIILMACTLIGGCAVGPDYQPPDPELPELPDGTGGTPMEETLQWWQAFQDPALNRLLAAAVEQNHEIAAAQANLTRARAVAAAVEGPYYPHLDLNASAIRQERSENSLFPVLEENPGFPDRTVTLFHASFDAAWEVDLFGGTRRTIEAGKEQAAQAEFTLQDLQASLLAETGRLYVLYLALNERASFLHENIAAQTEILDVVTARYKSGTASDLEVAQARTRLHQLNAELPGLVAERDTTLSSLSVLTVLPPDNLRGILGRSEKIPTVEAFVGTRIDSDLLRQRPDIRVAESRIRQANSALGARISNLYPRFILVGSLGLESIDADTFTETASRLWRLGPTITLPILHGGALRQQVKAAEASLDMAVARYREQVLEALRESESALIRFDQSREAVDQSALACQASAEASRIARVQFDTGVLPLDRLLAVETSERIARDQLTQAQSKVAISLIHLGKALGGAWDLKD